MTVNAAYIPKKKGPYRVRTPSTVSKIIDRGSYGHLGLLRESPTRVLKFCVPEREIAVLNLETEKKILEILGHHQHIIHLYSASEQGLCFEYYPLRSIRRYYESLNGSLPSLNRRLQWCHQSAAGYAYIHSKNIVHNDVSARNILLSSDMKIKICDFGAAAQVGDVIHGLGEFRYVGSRVPPESKASFIEDIFAIGGLSFEIISGKPPYEELDRSEVSMHYRNKVFPSLDRFDPDYARIIHNCWNERYSSIRALENDLPPLSSAPAGTVQTYDEGLALLI